MDRKYFQGIITGVFLGFIIFMIIYAGGLNNKLGKIKDLYEKTVDNGATSENQEVDLDEKIDTLFECIDKYYYEDVNHDELVEGVYKGLLAGIGDPYSNYFSKKEYEQFKEAVGGKYSGIGVLISYDEENNRFLVSLPFEGGPGAKAGLLPGDQIVKVEDTDVKGFDIDKLVTMIKGEEGTSVELSIYREDKDETIDVDIVREEINVPTVSHEMLDNKIGLIKIVEFDEVTLKQFSDALDELEKDGQKGLIIDLRNNPGGQLDTVKKITEKFLPKDSMIVYTEDKYGNKEELKSDTKTGKQFTKPLVVLINENSASASEIFSGVVKDYKIGTLVGTKTYGKGIVQTILPLEDGSAIKLTISKYFTPNGNYIHGKGIEPDIKVELPDETKKKMAISKEEDVQLKKAIEVINSNIK